MMLNRRMLRTMAVILGILAVVLSLSTSALLAQETSEYTITVQPGESIQAAIDQAPEGAVICLPAGIWEENIKIEKSITLRGAGAETIIDGVKEGYPVVWVMGPEEAVQAISVKIEGLTITGAEGECADEDKKICAYGVLIQGAAQVAITGSTISGNERDGIVLLDSAQGEITGSTISANRRDGIVLRETAKAVITGSTISENRCGIGLVGSARAEITGSTISDNEWLGILLGETARAEITDSTISENEHGIGLVGSAKAVITGSTISANRWNGIGLVDSAQAEITDSTISENEHGIGLVDSAQAEITGSIISGNRWNGIELSDSAQAEITDNLIQGNRWVGIESHSAGPVTGSNNTMLENGIDLLGNLPSGLRVPLVEATEQEIQLPDPAYPTLQHAVDALLPGGRLILSEGVYTSGVTIDKDLTIEAKEGTAPQIEGGAAVISLVGTARVKLSGLLLTGGGYGLAGGATAQAAITGSTISGNGRDGIELRGSAQAEITGSIISDNRADGIYLRNESIFGLVDSRILRNQGYGVSAHLPGCVEHYRERWKFTGQVTGSGNLIPGPDEPDGNQKGAVCPPELAFLMTEEGGELDRRKQP